MKWCSSVTFLPVLTTTNKMGRPLKQNTHFPFVPEEINQQIDHSALQQCTRSEVKGADGEGGRGFVKQVHVCYLTIDNFDQPDSNKKIYLLLQIRYIFLIGCKTKSVIFFLHFDIYGSKISVKLKKK